MLLIPPPRSRQKKKPAPTALAPPTPIPPSLTILSVVRNGSSSYAVTFSNAPTLISTPVPNGGFAVNGQPPSSLSAPTGNQVTISFASSNSGLPWTVSAQPNWLGVPRLRGHGRFGNVTHSSEPKTCPRGRGTWHPNGLDVDGVAMPPAKANRQYKNTIPYSYD